MVVANYLAQRSMIPIIDFAKSSRHQNQSGPLAFPARSGPMSTGPNPVVTNVVDTQEALGAQERYLSRLATNTSGSSHEQPQPLAVRRLSVIDGPPGTAAVSSIRDEVCRHRRAPSSGHQAPRAVLSRRP